VTEEASDREVPPPLFLVHDDSLDRAVREADSGAQPAALLPWSDRDSAPDGARVLVCLGDERIREIALLALQRRWQVGVLPHPEAPQAMAALGVRGSLAEMLAHYRRAPVVSADLLTCNGEPVFNSVVIGKVLALRPRDINRPQTAWSLLAGALRGLGRMRLTHYTLTTSKERKISMAALGMVAFGQTQSRLMERAFAEELGIADGRLSLLALAPRSVFSYLRFLARMLWPTKIRLSRLPPSLSLVQTPRLHITAPQGSEYLIDGKPVHASDIELQVAPERLSLLPGPALSLHGEQGKPVSKETVRLNHVPVEEGARPLLQQSLPVFDHASEEEYRGLFVALRDNAAATSSFQMLMVLSVLLACGGMYANSAPVIIGAMILAPLMSPIISLAMGMARTDAGLMRTSLRTLGIGVAWGLACAVLMAWALPLETPTLEMKSRMSPTLLDLLVAVLSGIAGAYANAKEEIAKSLAGVAIAVALVPPLSVVGIGLGWGDGAMAWGAALLLLTNLVGIALAASATFLVLGFAPFHRARAGLAVAFAVVLAISVPLTLSFTHLVERDRILENVPRGAMQLGGVEVHVGQVTLKYGDPYVIRLVASATEPLRAAQVDELKAEITRRLDIPVMLEVQSAIRR